MNGIVRKRSSEQGQTIVIFALSIVVLLGFAGLALDGGMLYSDRRHAQSAADTSSLAGATAAATYMQNNNINKKSFQCGLAYVLNAQQAAENAAISRASTNDYNLDNDISDHHGVTTTCGVEDQGYRLVKYIDITTKITRDTSTNFAHLVYPGPLVNEVEAVVRVYPPGPLAEGYAIVALNAADCSGNQNGLILGGSTTGVVTGSSGIFTNGCLRGDGSNFILDVMDEGIVGYAGTATGTLSGINPPPEYSLDKIAGFATNVPPPDCSGLTRTAPHGGNKTITPGKYEKIQWTSGTLTLNPGLYCITKSQGFNVLGGSLFANGVTIYLEVGGMTISGNVDPVSLQAPIESPDTSPAIPGMLIYMAEGNTSTITLNGNSSSSFVGTIYAPDGSIELTGNTDITGGDTTFNTQLIGYNVHINGDATININFLDEEQIEKPPFLDLLQ